MLPSLRRSSRLTLRLAACTSALLLTGAFTAASHRCSKFALPDGSVSIVFVGTATTETRMADASPVIGPEGTPFIGKAKAHVFDVARLGGVDRLKAGSSVQRIAVVPWSYTDDCRPLMWNGPSDWVRAGATGLVYGTLRAREYWVDDLPTIDMHNPYDSPFPARRPGVYPFLSADQAFTLLSVTPTADDLSSLGMAALAPLIDILDRDPGFGGGEGKRRLGLLLRGFTDRRLRSAPAPMAGTYRMSLELSDGRERTFFARMEARPLQVIVEEGDGWVAERRIPEPRGYTLLVAVAGELDELPASRQGGRYGYFHVTIPRDSTTRPVTWSASAESTVLRNAFPVDVAVQSFTAPNRNRAPASDNIATNPRPGVEAGFRFDEQGRVTFEQRFLGPGGASAVLRGVRISLETLPFPR